MKRAKQTTRKNANKPFYRLPKADQEAVWDAVASTLREELRKVKALGRQMNALRRRAEKMSGGGR